MLKSAYEGSSTGNLEKVQYSCCHMAPSGGHSIKLYSNQTLQSRLSNFSVGRTVEMLVLYDNDLTIYSQMLTISCFC